MIGTPDRAQLTFSVQTENANVKTAQSGQCSADESRDRCTGRRRDPKGRNENYRILNLPGIRGYSNGLLNPKIRTYQVTNTLPVTLHDVNQTGNVIDTAVTNGINPVSSIQFIYPMNSHRYSVQMP